MFELFFVITTPQFTIKEQWPTAYESKADCMEAGWIKADILKDQIVLKYPNIKGFDLECKSKMRTQDIKYRIHQSS